MSWPLPGLGVGLPSFLGLSMPAVGLDELALLPMYHAKQQRPSSTPPLFLPIRSL